MAHIRTEITDLLDPYTHGIQKAQVLATVYLADEVHELNNKLASIIAPAARGEGPLQNERPSALRTRES